MNREAFKQRMQNLKSYREQNPGKGYWDFKSYEDGGEVPPTNKPTIVEPTEQKAHMNQLREYMFQNGMIGTRGQTVDAKMMKKVLDQISKTDSMKEVARASKQFNNINKYTKWFNSIPLLGVGALGVYSNENTNNQ